MEIKIIGSRSDNGIVYKKRVLEAAMDIDDRVIISLVDDVNLINKYNIKKMPALIINDDMVIEGRMITVRELIKILKSKDRKKISINN